MADKDRPVYAPPSHLALSRTPAPGEPLWQLHYDGHMWSAMVRVRGGWGIEAHILKDGELVIGRRFYVRWRAEEWAAEERKAIEHGAEL